MEIVVTRDSFSKNASFICISSLGESNDPEKLNGYIVGFEELCAAFFADPTLDVLFLGDTNHSNQSIESKLQSLELLKELREKGLDLVMVEADSAHYNNHFVKPIEHLPKGYESNDLRELFKTVNTGQKRVENHYVWLKEAFDLNIEVQGVDPWAHEKKLEIEDLEGNSERSFLKALFERLETDSLLNERIVELSTKHEKSLLIYGNLHGARLGDGLLEDPRIKIVKISVYGSVEDLSSDLYSISKLEKLIYPDLVDGDIISKRDYANFAYIMEDETVIPLSNENDNLLLELFEREEVEIINQEIVVSELLEVLPNFYKNQNDLKNDFGN